MTPTVRPTATRVPAAAERSAEGSRVMSRNTTGWKTVTAMMIQDDRISAI
ncbi:MAG: hypothetical protein ACR2JK_06295 [Geodermatophilaceae bacterium]